MLALRGKCTQRNFWIGDSMVDSLAGLTSPSLVENATRFFSAKKRSPPGSLYSMAKPAKSAGGLPRRQFIASSAMPSPRCTLRVKSAAALPPLT